MYEIVEDLVRYTTHDGTKRSIVGGGRTAAELVFYLNEAYTEGQIANENDCNQKLKGSSELLSQARKEARVWEKIARAQAELLY